MAPFPDTPAELPGIAIAQAKNAYSVDIVEEEEAEVDEVVEGTDIDQGIPHLAFGQKDNTLENYDTGDVDMVPMDNVDEQQLVNDIVNPVNPPTPEGPVGEFINELDQVQGEIDVALEQIKT